MDDRASDAAIEERLRSFLAGELRRAELDYGQVAAAGVRAPRSARAPVMVALTLVVVAAVVLAHPWTGPTGGSTGGVPSASIARPSGSITTSATAGACRSALAEGYLVADHGGLTLHNLVGDIEDVEWPPGYSVRGDGDSVVLVDPNGAIKARPGDYVKFGGGVGNDDVFHGCGEVTVVAGTGIDGPKPGDTIDGFKLGVMVTCSPPVGSIDPSLAADSCSGRPALALAALDARDPGHAAVIRTDTFSDGTQPEPVDVSGNAPTPTPPATAHPGPHVTVFVFTLADGSVRATGVACPDPGPCVGVGTYPH